MTGPLHIVFEPGFFSSGTVHAALVMGAVVAAVTGTVGTFTVLRAQSFAGHALGELGATGGSAAFLAGTNPLAGFVGIAVISAAVIEALGLRRPRTRDLATGLVLGAGLGLAALFLYLDTTSTSTTGASITILFGSLFAVSNSMVPSVVGLGGLALALVAVCYRMLLLGSLDADMAAAKGVPVRVVGAVYLLALALAVSLAAETIGAVLSTALLVGPPASALRLTKQPGRAVVTSAVTGIAACWLGVLLAYDSYYWPPVRHGWPVSFLIVAIIFVFYLGVDVCSPGRRHRRPVLEASADA
ncbi:MAG TPA: metal ABC transporter permease [Acidimicrobiales bacterium]|nr:metal ABC transporter permease [Acidimicrobiales bacterium]